MVISICSSINNEVVYPNPKKVIRRRYPVDTGATNRGFHGDLCITIAVGEVTPEAAKLIRGGRRSPS